MSTRFPWKSLVAIHILAVCFAATVVAQTHTQEQSYKEMDKFEREFLQVCVGVDMDGMKNAAAQMIAKAHCYGHIRGVVEGSLLATAFARRSGMNLGVMWCIPNNQVDADLYANLLGWTIVNNVEFQKLKLDNKDHPRDVILFVFVRAFQQSYSCPKV